MADSNQKKNDFDLPALGEIDFNDSGDVPGVTQLLTPSLLKGRKKNEAGPAPAAPAAPVEAPALEEEIPEEPEAIEPGGSDEFHPVDSLPEAPFPSWETMAREIGVRFELTFRFNGVVYAFSGHVEHAPHSFEPWRNEFFNGMTFEPARFSLNTDFEEFEAKTRSFLRDALGAGDQDHLIFARNGNELRILFSPHSLHGHRDGIKSWLSPGTPAATKEAPSVKQDYDPGEDDGIKIEIA